MNQTEELIWLENVMNMFMNNSYTDNFLALIFLPRYFTALAVLLVLQHTKPYDADMNKQPEANLQSAVCECLTWF